MPTSKLQSLFLIPSNDNRSTFGEDATLPSLPLPNLDSTLDRYIDSLKPFLTESEFAKSEKLVEDFRNGIGQTLHETLKQKAENERNWIEKWWEDIAYLQVRLPLIPYCSMDGVLPKNITSWSYGSEDDQIKHASVFGYYLVQYWNLLRKEKLLPSQTSDKKIKFSMSQYRRLYNTVRVPGEEMDSLVSYFKTAAEGFCPATVIILCRGRIFCINALDPKGNPLSPFEWEKALRVIIEKCEENDDESSTSSSSSPSLPILTCDTRSNWSKNRKRLETLSNKNEEMLRLIEKSLFVLVLDDDCPETDSDVTNCNLCGDYRNRWCDKSMSMIFYKNGRSGAVCDHTAFDGIVVISCHHYVLTAVEEEEISWDEKESISVPPVAELNFEVDSVLKGEINRLKSETELNRNEILMTRHMFEDYGKVEIQRLKFNPDSYIQMCLQLAYFAMHRKPAPCYETATTRKFYNGRTETVRSCTTQCLDWIVSMLDTNRSKEEKKLLLEKAIKRHDELMNEAKENAGCDRHLFGIYCTALEEGIEIPELFLDSGYLKSGGGGNFILSTSCTGYTPLGGGVAPMCLNGYGVFYNIMPDKICFTVSVNTKSKETDAQMYFQNLKDALGQTRLVCLMTSRTSSKF